MHANETSEEGHVKKAGRFATLYVDITGSKVQREFRPAAR